MTYSHSLLRAFSPSQPWCRCSKCGQINKTHRHTHSHIPSLSHTHTLPLSHTDTHTSMHLQTPTLTYTETAAKMDLRNIHPLHRLKNKSIFQLVTRSWFSYCLYVVEKTET